MGLLEENLKLFKLLKEIQVNFTVEVLFILILKAIAILLSRVIITLAIIK